MQTHALPWRVSLKQEDVPILAGRGNSETVWVACMRRVEDANWGDSVVSNHI